MDSVVKSAVSDAQIGACFPVVALLRPHLQRHEFVPLVRRMFGEGYGLAYVEAEDGIQAVVGYRIVEMLRTGRMLEVDDLVSATAARSKGYGKKLLDWCADLARANQCSVIELDSGVHRADAHRFYFRERMHMLGFHFSRSLDC